MYRHPADVSRAVCAAYGDPVRFRVRQSVRAHRRRRQRKRLPADGGALARTEYHLAVHCAHAGDHRPPAVRPYALLHRSRTRRECNGGYTHVSVYLAEKCLGGHPHGVYAVAARHYLVNRADRHLFDNRVCGCYGCLGYGTVSGDCGSAAGCVPAGDDSDSR